MIYELIIIGAGPAGLAAALYAARYNIKTLVIAKTVGGTILDAYKVCNYPGFDEISGIELITRFEEQVKKLGVEIRQEAVSDIKVGEEFLVKTNSLGYKARALILALGNDRRKLGVAGEEKCIGKGVSYCTVCDAALFKDKIVAVVGGSNAAAMSAELLTNYAKKIYVIYRKDEMRAEPYVVEILKKNKKIEFVYNTNIVKINSDNFLKSVELDNGTELKLDGLFVEVGSVPSKVLPQKLGLKTSEAGYIITDNKQQTSTPGIFAAGDITANTLKQVVTACAEGAIAANSVYKYLRQKR